MNRTVLIAGASRGLGLELAVQYAAEGWEVLAACRDPEEAHKWLPPSVKVLKLDLTSATSIGALAWELDEAPLDLLICCGGVYGAETDSFLAPGDDEFDRVMHTNVLGHARVIQAFAPCVVAARGMIVTLTSKMGSISETTGSGALAYRASKAALNIIAKAASNEFGPQGATVVTMHPGWVRTDMGGTEAPLTVIDAVEQIRGTLAGLGHSDNGRFIDFSGRSIDW
ncbi:MAG: SDR family NAD(P)-dependent oxidoreductase [Moraxellaceae bacterium]|nr:SDR family NAD(P)-dependent oxidoreductase [Moraxellaceae bacterium]